MSAVRAVVDVARREPVATLAVVQAVIVCVVVFGVSLSDAQTAGILGVVWAALTLLARSRVTPVTPVMQPAVPPAPPGPGAAAGR